ncbi:hypothetical protein [Streptomyces sp. ISL-86]|uniref:hypothetical protein n=1 Tax=Streptomyces sp. ISL-86 TaxID=2819187 RepID=UPI001BED2004|nr:hypothetical protein [Streptomyces sp. ISL-86]MBT2460001.1 hypothetical protein [Streptomyces sp. ISL-86]
MAGKAQAAWDALNERQRAYMHVLYDHDQAAEEQRAADWAAGRTLDDRTPASQWRWIDVVTPGTKLTSVQRHLAKRDVRDPGVGSTLAALARAGLIELEEVPRGRSRAVRAKTTRTGRAAVRTAIKAAPGRRTGELADWSWEILVRLWQADGAQIRSGGPAVERTFLDRKPPLAVQHEYPWYSITEAGREHYRQGWARYAQLFPVKFFCSVMQGCEGPCGVPCESRLSQPRGLLVHLWVAGGECSFGEARWWTNLCHEYSAQCLVASLR